MGWSSIISGVVSIGIGIMIFLELISENYPKEKIFWSFIFVVFFIGIGISIILYSEKADKIERIRGKK